MRSIISEIRKAFVASLFIGCCCFSGEQQVHAQQSSSFSYYNPRTGFGYSQGWSMSPNGYSSGFGFTSPRSSYSTFSGNDGRRIHYGSNYSTGRHGYSQFYSVGRRR